jgi:hypothetical protein
MVEIIPKPPERIPLWQNLIIFFSIVILIIAILAYFFLGYLQKKASLQLDEIRNKIAQTETPDRKELKADLLIEKKKIDNFAFILNEHLASSNFFTFLEGITHPKIWFSNLKLDVSKATVELSGEGEKLAFGQQLLIFKQNEKILRADSSKISIKAPENVEFSLSLSLDPEIFKFLK